MQEKFWKPTITSQFRVCCVPYHMDTYRGCTYGCLYCFARDLSTFAEEIHSTNSLSIWLKIIMRVFRDG